jgi:hypothetical protein
MSDKFGHFQHAGKGDYQAPTFPKEAAIHQFAKHLAKYLAKRLYEADCQHQYHFLILVMPAHFYGLLLQHLHAAFRLQ